MKTNAMIPMPEADRDFSKVAQREKLAETADRLIAENLEAFQELAK